MKIGIIVHTVIVRQDGKVLLLKRASHNDVEPNLWDIPGGTLEWGEDPNEGAQRELLAEAGLHVDQVHLFGQLSNIDTEKNKQFVRLLFWASYVGGHITLAEDEHSEYVWIDPNDIASYQHVPFVRYALENYPA